MTKIEMELRGFLSKNQVLVGVQGAKPPEANGKKTRFSMFCPCLYSMMMQYDSISILLK